MLLHARIVLEDVTKEGCGKRKISVMRYILILCIALSVGLSHAIAEETHSHPPPERLGKVVFNTSCSPEVEHEFSRGVALLHSFTYEPAEAAFRAIAAEDPRCAMAHWGIALSRYHPLWAAPSPEDLKVGAEAVKTAMRLSATDRERMYINAADAFYRQSDKRPHADRARAYEHAMAELAGKYPEDLEAQILYALALLSTAPSTDTSHLKQKKAATILEPLYTKLPDHPGLAHYLIHAYDSSELASQGLDAAREYSQIAASAPHALHMPSHIFTRLGFWEESITSNQAAREAASKAGDIGEALHAMDYLTYAYLQLGDFESAKRIVEEATSSHALSGADFKIGYAANAMPVRLAIEQRQWPVVSTLEPIAGSAPHVAAIVYWARALGKARAGEPGAASTEIERLETCHKQLLANENTYWAKQTAILLEEANAWAAFAKGDRQKAIAMMRAAADEEDSLEKLPVTPGPIVPAREQLGEMLLDSGRPDEALPEFSAVLRFAPGRRGAISGLGRAREAIAASN